jgi:hypothetical protein
VQDHQYDIILSNADDILESIQQAKINRSARLFREGLEKISPESIQDTDLVFRVMTWSHIPMLPPKSTPEPEPSSTGSIINRFFEDIDDDTVEDELSVDADPLPKNYLEQNNIKADHIRINFPPFVHYRLDNSGTPYLVGKSHWIGDLETGEFCKTQGDLTENLARMIMKLAEKYASKGNWRNYSYREEMEGQAVMQLVQVCLLFDESKSSNPFAFLTTISRNAFLRILNVEKRNQKIRDDILVKNGMNPSYTRSNQNVNLMYDGYSD